MARIDLTDGSTWQETVDVPTLLGSLPHGSAWQIGVTGRSDSQGNPRLQDRFVVDNKYRRNVDTARQVGKPVVHYYVPINRPWAEQFAWIRQQLGGPLPPGEAMFVDAEPGANYRSEALGWPAHQSLLHALDDWNQRETALYGRLYKDVDPTRLHWATYFNDQSGSEAMRAKMLVEYKGVNVFVWQWTSLGRLPGCTTNIDLNEILDFAKWRRFLGLPATIPPPPVSPPPPPPPPVPTSGPSFDVILGWQP